ncbi:MAG: response regulator [Deltaproteobacteria bacterium]|nr:response regulator [Deltaproteobacteria bacterium]
MARILVVDDEKSIRFTLASFLKKEGYEVDTAQDAESALELLGENIYDVVLTDIVMPRISGVDLLKAIRSLSPTARVIMMTGAPSLDTVKDSLLSGAFEYLYKPFSKETVLETVQKAVTDKKEGDEKEILEAQKEQKAYQMSEMLTQKTRALRESEDRYRVLVEASPDGIALWDHDGGILFVNSQALAMGGYESELDVLGSQGFLWIAPESRGRALADVEELRRSRAVLTREYEMIRSDGSRYRVEARFTLVPSQEEENGNILFIFQDITRRHESIRRLLLLGRALDQALDGVAVTDLSGRIVFANRAWAQMHQWPENRVEGSHLSDFASSEAYADEMSPFLERLSKEGRSEALVKHSTRAGGEFLSRMSASIVEDESGGPLAWTITAQDLSEEMKMQDQLRKAQKMEAIGTLSAGIAHDFNNILCSIIGYADLVLPRLTPGSSVHGNVKAILNAGNRARDLVQQMLSSTRRTEKGRAVIEMQPIVKEVVKFIRSGLPSTIEIETNLQTRARIMADPTQIHQVVMNLCTNAGHAMAEKGGVLSVDLVEVAVTEEKARAKNIEPGRYAALIIADTGVGIEQSVVDRIFDPYFTTKEVGQGTGLGLAIVRGIVEGVNGSISVESEVGRGTSFTVLFRVEKGEGAAPVVVEATPMPRGSESILFVDDDPLISALIRQTFTGLGYRVQAETDPLKALKAFTEKPEAYDMVITDMTMPHLTGDELALRVMTIKPSMPVVICTGYQDRVASDDLVAMGIKEFVFKPLDLHHFTNLVRRLLDEAA